MTKPPRIARRLVISKDLGLCRGAVHRARDGRERIVELAAEGGRTDDDGDANQGGDQAVLDRRHTGLVLKKANEQVHFSTPCAHQNIILVLAVRSVSGTAPESDAYLG